MQKIILVILLILGCEHTNKNIVILDSGILDFNEQDFNEQDNKLEFVRTWWIQGEPENSPCYFIDNSPDEEPSVCSPYQGISLASCDTVSASLLNDILLTDLMLFEREITEKEVLECLSGMVVYIPTSELFMEACNTYNDPPDAVTHACTLTSDKIDNGILDFNVGRFLISINPDLMSTSRTFAEAVFRHELVHQVLSCFDIEGKNINHSWQEAWLLLEEPGWILFDENPDGDYINGCSVSCGVC